MTVASTKPLSVFYCYAREDAALRDELDKQLGTLRRLGWIESWYDRDIRAGTEWKQEIDTHLRKANIILLLVSADFIQSEYCYSIEMQEALRRHKAGEAVVIPIILRPVDWEDTPLGTLQVFPTDGKPVTSWGNLDAALFNVATGIRHVITSLRKWVCISSTPEDRTFALRLIGDLEGHGFTAWHTDDESIRDAADREEVVRQMIRVSQAYVLIASPHTQHARSIKEELRIAGIYQRPVVPVLAAGDTWPESIPREWGGISFFDAREHRYDQALQEIVASLEYFRSTASSAAPPPALLAQVHELHVEPRNPYKGLRTFQGEDARDFFGRDGLIRDLTNALQAALAADQQGRQGARLLAVVGPSGSGKSSVVLAGLLPDLQKGIIPGSREWHYLDFIVPGSHPLEALALSLARKLPERSVASVQEDLEADLARGLHRLARQIAPGSETKVVLLVDQFEELFTQTTSEEERQHFIDVLTTAMTEPRGPVIVLLTLRADFYDRPMQYPAFYRLIQAHQVAVLPMEAQEMRQVIERPAALPDVQLTFEEDLVGDLLFEVRGQIGALPLLQFTLDRLFDHRRGHHLTQQAYHEIGGVKGALAQHAESTYASLPTEEHRMLARELFLRLIDPGTAEQDTTRRRAALAELSFPDHTRSTMLRETAEAFIAARLLTTNEMAGRTTLEVSHEALIREWARLADWLRTDRSDILLQKALSEDAAEWIEHGKPADRLYRGAQLIEVQAWATRGRPNIDELDFLQVSVSEREREERERSAQQAREQNLQRRAARRQRYVIGMMAVTSLVIVGALLVTLLQQAQLLASLPVSVTNLNNDGPGSLRDAIATASPNGTITFAKTLQGTVILTSGPLLILKNLTISGPGASILAISGGNTSRVFVVGIDVIFTISNLTIEYGHATDDIDPYSGGGILNEGELFLINSSISNNAAGFTDTGKNEVISFGGGIDNRGALTLANSTVSNNVASYSGGGIGNSGSFRLINSIITGNRARQDGGGIETSPGSFFEPGIPSSIAYTLIDNNFAGEDGGGINKLGGMVTLTNSTISNNKAGSLGGGIENFGTLTLTSSTISGNMSNTYGGGINSYDSSLTLTNSTISGNTAKGDGGGIATSDTNDSISFCTIYGNTARTGGGIFSSGTGVWLSASIVAGDRAGSGPDVVGAITLFLPDLIQNISRTKYIFDTDPSDPASTVAKKSIFDKSPNVGPLQDNGGPTKTHALLPGSPAIDQIYSVFFAGLSVPECPELDQRGFSRMPTTCDIGAYQHTFSS